MTTTIDDLRAMTKATITPKEAADVLGMDPQSIRVAAHQRPELLGFPVMVLAHRVRIPRVPFIQFITGGS